MKTKKPKLMCFVRCVSRPLALDTLTPSQICRVCARALQIGLRVSLGAGGGHWSWDLSINVWHEWFYDIKFPPQVYCYLDYLPTNNIEQYHNPSLRICRNLCYENFEADLKTVLIQIPYEGPADWVDDKKKLLTLYEQDIGIATACTWNFLIWNRKLETRLWKV